MKKKILFKSMLVLAAMASLSSCYDMDGMSKNPFELPDNTIQRAARFSQARRTTPSTPTSTSTIR